MFWLNPIQSFVVEFGLILARNDLYLLSLLMQVVGSETVTVLAVSLCYDPLKRWVQTCLWIYIDVWGVCTPLSFAIQFRSSRWDRWFVLLVCILPTHMVSLNWFSVWYV